MDPSNQPPLLGLPHRPTNPKTTPKPLPELLTPDLLCVSVGTEGKVYHIHRAVLCARSPAFNAGYGSSSRWVEGDSTSINLPDERSQVFDLFVQWLYGGALPSISIGGQALPHVQAGSLPAYIHLYRFADERLVEILKTCVMRRIHRFYENHNYFVLEHTLRLVYEITPPHCDLRRYMARAWVFHQSRSMDMPFGQIVSDMLRVGGDFAEDVALAGIELSLKKWDVPNTGPFGERSDDI